MRRLRLPRRLSIDSFAASSGVRWMPGKPSATSMMHVRPVFAALLGVIACTPTSSVASAYADPRVDCRSLETLLAPGPGSTPAMAPALWRVRACPARAGAILATALRASQQERDTSVLEDRTWLTQFVHDAALLAAGVGVATDTLATSEARVAAFRVLLWSKAPGHLVPLRAMTEGLSCIPPRCYDSYTGHFYRGGPTAADTAAWPVVGRAMPHGYVEQIDSVAAAVASAPGTSAAVRRAAQLTAAMPADRELAGR